MIYKTQRNLLFVLVLLVGSVMALTSFSEESEPLNEMDIIEKGETPKDATDLKIEKEKALAMIVKENVETGLMEVYQYDGSQGVIDSEEKANSIRDGLTNQKPLFTVSKADLDEKQKQAQQPILEHEMDDPADSATQASVNVWWQPNYSGPAYVANYGSRFDWDWQLRNQTRVTTVIYPPQETRYPLEFTEFRSNGYGNYRPFGCNNFGGFNYYYYYFYRVNGWYGW